MLSSRRSVTVDVVIRRGAVLPTAGRPSSAWWPVGQLVAFAVTMATFLQAIVSEWIALGVAFALVVAGMSVLAAGTLRSRPEALQRPLTRQRTNLPLAGRDAQQSGR